MTASFFWLTVYLHKYHEVGAAKKFNSVFCTEYIVKMMLTVAMALFFIFLALSRVFLGEHSYNQVLFGSQLGIALACILHYFVKPLIKHFPSWARDKYGIQKQKGIFEISNALIILAFLVTIVLPITVSTSIYLLVSSNSSSFDSNKEAIIHRMKMFCPNATENFFTTALYNEGLLHSGVIGFTGGAILGQLFEMRFVKINLSYSLWNRTSIPLTLVRILL